MADELRVARDELGLDELEIALLGLVGQLLAADGLLEHVHEVDRVGTDLRGVVVERGRQHLEGEARRGAVHALVTPAASLYSWTLRALGSDSFRLSPS